VETGVDACAGVTLEPGDRIVAEIGYACTGSSRPAVSGSIWRGGEATDSNGNTEPLDRYESPLSGKPGYLRLSGGWVFEQEAGTCGPPARINVNPRQLLEVTVAGNQVTAATIEGPEGRREYTYEYDDNDALASKTDAVTGGQWTYNYDLWGNLRTVVMPDQREIRYVIDPGKRQAGRKICESGGSPCTHDYSLIYQSALRPIA